MENASRLQLLVDAAVRGDEPTELRWARGDFKIDQHLAAGLSTVSIANVVERLLLVFRPDKVMVTRVGIGAGVADLLRSRGFEVEEV